MKTIFAKISLTFVTIVCFVVSSEAVITTDHAVYDASLGTLPDAQGWTVGPNGGGSMVGSVLHLDDKERYGSGTLTMNTTDPSGWTLSMVAEVTQGRTYLVVDADGYENCRLSRLIVNMSDGNPLTDEITTTNASYGEDLVGSNPTGFNIYQIYFDPGVGDNGASKYYMNGKLLDTILYEDLYSEVGGWHVDELVFGQWSNGTCDTDVMYVEFSLGKCVVEIGVVITESAGSTIVEEGGISDSYDIRLKKAPIEGRNVVITATPADSQVDLGGGAGVAVSLQSFTSDNWYVPQTITVIATDDDIAEGKDPNITLIHHDAQSDDPEYNQIDIIDIAVEVIDNEPHCGHWGYYPADINRDCYVNLRDFALFVFQWLKLD